VSDLTAFLLARLDEDEAKAREAIEMRMAVKYVDPSDATRPDFELVAWPDLGVPSMLIGPERVLAECEAKRRIVALAPWCNNSTAGSALIDLPGNLVLRDLAAVYSDHPDYDEAWRP
jgi:hypothetical protein